MENQIMLDNDGHYTVELSADGSTAVFTWKAIEGLTCDDGRRGIEAFAHRCKDRRPTLAVIDARKLDPEGEVLGWVSGQATPPGEEEYATWWSREIAPVYHDAGVAGLAVATGNPEAPGEIPTPPDVHFKIGYFYELDDALAWSTA